MALVRGNGKKKKMRWLNIKSQLHHLAFKTPNKPSNATEHPELLDACQGSISNQNITPKNRFPLPCTSAVPKDLSKGIELGSVDMVQNDIGLWEILGADETA